MPIQFFSEEVEFQLPEIKRVSAWLNRIVQDHKHQIADLNYVFCSDEYLLKINRDHLNHDYYTDIITFDNSEEVNVIEGDVFISVDRVKDNATELKSEFDSELHRVIIHGLLHLLGYNDKTQREMREMREKEDSCISLL